MMEPLLDQNIGRRVEVLVGGRSVRGELVGISDGIAEIRHGPSNSSTFYAEVSAIVGLHVLPLDNGPPQEPELDLEPRAVKSHEELFAEMVNDDSSS